MLESKLQKKYDFYEFYSELKIPQENYESSVDHNNSLENNSPTQLDFDISCNDNNLNIENSTFIIKAPKASKILLILSIDKDLPSKIEKNIYSINFDYPVFQAISFMHESQNESILILTGSKNLVDKNEVFQIQIKQLMHEALYNLLKDIKNAIKVMPIKDNLALVLHQSTEIYKIGGLKLWKDFQEEIYNFNTIYNFTYNFEYNKVICIDNKQAPFIISIYSFDESHFNKKNNELLQPEFFVQIGDYVQNIKEDDIDNFLDFESFDNIILFWGKTKTEKNEFLLGIFFINFKEKKCLDYREIDFDGNKKYLFKINKNTNEIYIFNLSEEFLYIFSFITKKKNQIQKSADDLYLSKIKFSGNIKGIDFTANNGMVVLTEQYNLVCYSRNEYLFKSYQKKYDGENSENGLNIENNKIKINSDELINKSINKEDLVLTKSKSENLIRSNILSQKEDYNKCDDNINKTRKNIYELNDKNINNFNKDEKKEEIKEKINEEEDKKIKELSKKNLELLIKQKELIEKLKKVNKEKMLISKLVESYKEKISNFENKILSGISKLKLEDLFNQIQAINIDNTSINFENLYYDMTLIKAKNMINEIKNIIPEIINIKNKIIYFTKQDIKYKKENNLSDNCDFESKELINKVINIELKEKTDIKNKINKIINSCSLINKKINKILEINGFIQVFNKKLNLLLFKCMNDINQINEMYKYNKFILTKEEESKLIQSLISPFIILYSKIVTELENKINIFIKEKESFNSKSNNENINENNNKESRGSMLLEKLENIFERYNFYSLNQNIIENQYIDLENEFEY